MGEGGPLFLSLSLHPRTLSLEHLRFFPSCLFKSKSVSIISALLTYSQGYIRRTNSTSEENEHVKPGTLQPVRTERHAMKI